MIQQLSPKTKLHNGDYQIEQMLGQGGFGITYRAIRTADQHTVAIKELFLQGINERNTDNRSTVLVSNNANTVSFEQQKSKFAKEARRLMGLDNAHIVKVYDFFEENGTAYYAMDYVQGRSLADLAKSGDMTEERLEDLTAQLLEALETIHAHNIWHLDIKPANILVDNNGQAVLIDFGASKHVDQGGNMTTSSALAFTPGFAPPEQMQGAMESFGPWTDFYALGATLYNVLTLKTPPTFADILSEGEQVFNFPPTMSDTMKHNIVWMMKPNRRERPQSVKDFISGQNKVQSVDTAYEQAEETRLSQRQANDEAGGGSKKFLYIVAAVALVAIVVGVGIFISNDNKKEADDYYYYETAEYDNANTEPAATTPDYYDSSAFVHEDVIIPQNIRRWDGSYEAENCSGDTYGGTGICYTTSLELMSNNDTEYYSGTIRVEGWQIGWYGDITATAFDDNSIKIWLDGSPEGMGCTGLTGGDAIVRIHYNSNGTYSADWLSPVMIDAEYVNQHTSIRMQ